jgi:hypothetical protein
MDGRQKRRLKTLGRYALTRDAFFFIPARSPTGQHVADLVGADPKDIVFTSGATESNNMSIKGVARFHREKKRHVITTQTVRSRRLRMKR